MATNIEIRSDTRQKIEIKVKSIKQGLEYLYSSPDYICEPINKGNSGEESSQPIERGKFGTEHFESLLLRVKDNQFRRVTDNSTRAKRELSIAFIQSILILILAGTFLFFGASESLLKTSLISFMIMRSLISMKLCLATYRECVPVYGIIFTLFEFPVGLNLGLLCKININNEGNIKTSIPNAACFILVFYSVITMQSLIGQAWCVFIYKTSRKLFFLTELVQRLFVLVLIADSMGITVNAPGILSLNNSLIICCVISVLERIHWCIKIINTPGTVKIARMLLLAFGGVCITTIAQAFLILSLQNVSSINRWLLVTICILCSIYIYGYIMKYELITKNHFLEIEDTILAQKLVLDVAFTLLLKNVSHNKFEKATEYDITNGAHPNGEIMEFNDEDNLSFETGILFFSKFKRLNQIMLHQSFLEPLRLSRVS